MIYEKRNKYTWVLKEKEKNNTAPISDAVSEKPTKQNSRYKTAQYRAFCKRLFTYKKFVCKTELNILIKEQLHDSAGFPQRGVQCFQTRREFIKDEQVFFSLYLNLSFPAGFGVSLPAGFLSKLK